MKHFLLLLLRNVTKKNSIKFSAARLHVSFDQFWNCLKDLKCKTVKNSCLLVNKRNLCATKLKKNICKTFYRLKCKEFRQKSHKSAHLLRCTKCVSHVGYWYITIHFMFFNLPTCIKWFVSWTVGNRLLKQLCGKMLDWSDFRLGEILGLIHAREKRYYQNKTQLRYNFGSVYYEHYYLTLFVYFKPTRFKRSTPDDIKWTDLLSGSKSLDSNMHSPL